ncbi:hypothetical protein TsFJ059_001388 [Trichoderma semiorbis]|uniref:Uncharacterized protein n=1 Tax=Trichoderma semiorbis TaxID=1491008 RepID=A0A9P8HZE3_9HYPO|nr:hypothetical protein TsFJ059_001388 [Trichoderma semiorbis]KAH0532741.1 hypothetical protein TsFJ059_001388 [Trichoderma semiorbis]
MLRSTKTKLLSHRIVPKNHCLHYFSSTFPIASSHKALVILMDPRSMATLAAIPEAASCLLDRNRIGRRNSLVTPSFQRQRPKSRVIILSKRSSRAHTPIRKASPPMTSPGSVYSNDTGPASEQPYAEMQPNQTHKSLPDVARRDQPYIRSAYDVGTAFRGVSMKSLDGASSLDQSWVPSEPSVDLDSFPLPPPKVPPQQTEYNVNPLSIAAKPSRDHASTLQKPETSTCFAGAGFSPPPVRRKAHMRMHRSPRSSHSLLLDGAADFVSASKHTSIDSALVEAISRSVCQQLRLFSARSRNSQERSFSRPFREASHTQQVNHPRIFNQSDQARIFNQSDQSDKLAGRHGQSRRTKHLRQHMNPPETPTKSNISLRTVSPLMPFRPEFKAAGLAVTSKDQKRGFPAYIARLISTRSTQRRANRSGSKHHAKVPKFDGFEEEDSSGSSMSQISFAPSQDMDEWRFALIDEAPVRKQKRQAAKDKRKTKRRWFPCFTRDEDSVADGS